jgi:hypothetical protein
VGLAIVVCGVLALTGGYFIREDGYHSGGMAGDSEVVGGYALGFAGLMAIPIGVYELVSSPPPETPSAVAVGPYITPDHAVGLAISTGGTF